jgi:hypothetical protein
MSAALSVSIAVSAATLTKRGRGMAPNRLRENAWLTHMAKNGPFLASIRKPLMQTAHNQPNPAPCQAAGASAALSGEEKQREEGRSHLEGNGSGTQLLAAWRFRKPPGMSCNEAGCEIYEFETGCARPRRARRRATIGSTAPLVHRTQNCGIFTASMCCSCLA